MTKEELKVAGAVLYVCEGTKLRKDNRYKNTYIYNVDFTNSNPKTVILFIRFLKEILKIDHNKIRVQLFLYQDHDHNELRKHWSSMIGLPQSQFDKVISLKSKNSKYKPNPLGTCKIRCYGKDVFQRLQSVIDEVWDKTGITI
ncbi:MAG: hypothetical protein WDZ82_02205 [Candidatus Paceibacterota bacterium]